MDLFIIIATWFVVVGGTLCIAGLLFMLFKDNLKSFWKKHVVDEFPSSLPPECFDCNQGSCDNCYILKGYKL